MRISELAATTGVPVHTLKYYLREGLLMPGEATSRDPRRLRPRSTSSGSASSAPSSSTGASGSPGSARSSTRSTLRHRRGTSCSAWRTAPCPASRDGRHGGTSTPSVRGSSSGSAGGVEDCAPAIGRLAAAVAARPGRRAPPARRGPRALRAGDARASPRSTSRSRRAPRRPRRRCAPWCVGTVLVDPVLLALRRLAQEAESAAHARA